MAEQHTPDSAEELSDKGGITLAGKAIERLGAGEACLLTVHAALGDLHKACVRNQNERLEVLGRGLNAQLEEYGNG